MAVPVVHFTDAALHLLDTKGNRALLTFRLGLRTPIAPDGRIDLAGPDALWSLRIVKHMRSRAKTSRYSHHARFSARLLVEVLEVTRSGIDASPR